MATGTWGDASIRSNAAWSEDARSLAGKIWYGLRVLGSLKITVTMFALGIVLLFVGTLAQDEQSIVDVKKLYFNSWIAVVALDLFAPQTVFPHDHPYPFAFPMPGGATVGLILLLNLIAAKLSRFSLVAKGTPLKAGIFFSLLGAALLVLIVVAAHLGDGLQGEPPFSYDVLWLMCKGTVWILTLATVYWALLGRAKTTMVSVVAWTLAFLMMGLSLALLLYSSSMRMPDPGLRVTWQLSKSFLVGGVLLTGLILLFGKRGGNVLIHVGVALLMLGQFLFGDAQVEERITFGEGDTTSESYRLEETELILVDSSDPKYDRVAAISDKALSRSAKQEMFVNVEGLPLEVRADQWMVNSQLEDNSKLAKNPATTGIGMEIGVIPQPKQGGVSEEANYASAYVTVREKETRKELGTYLVSQLLSDPQITSRARPESVKVGDKTFQMALRFRRTYKPYHITLDNVQRIDYVGTEKPQDYSSFVKIVGKDGTSKQEGRIWMNNPMRFQGETFYQSGYVSAAKSGRGVEVTTLQVVTNAGWLIPYVACVISGLGMLSHFSITFVRFASRYDRMLVQADALGRGKSVKDQPKVAKPLPNYVLQARQARHGIQGWLVPLLATGLVGLIAYALARPPAANRDEFHWFAAGQIPMQHEGRVKPMDTVARNILQSLSNRTSLYDEKKAKKYSAAHWMLAVMADQSWTDDAATFRIDAQHILAELKIDRVKGHKYSYNQIQPKLAEWRAMLANLPEDRKKWNFEQVKIGELVSKASTYEVLKFAYQPALPSPPQGDDEKARESFQQEFMMMLRHFQRLEQASPPAIIPPKAQVQADPEKGIEAAAWQAFGPALFKAFVAKELGQVYDSETVLAFSSVLDGIRAGNGRDFNRAVEDYRKLVDKDLGLASRTFQSTFEAWFNHWSPFNMAAFLYVLAGLLGFGSFLFARQTLRRASFWMCVAIFAIHTFAIIGRIIISERPPVINLYSSAVFIGWFICLCGLVIELIEPLGLGSMIASICGVLTMLVAYGLESGDTMPELQAVLDTQFWLSTHVISVTLGYGATFAAGAVGVALLGVMYWFQRNATTLFEDREVIERVLYRICYGIVCFGLFFSFVGTVLGGLWGDDSWGRFWGWDPKENGALMIVMWNAILLHARWDKQVGARGFAVLAVAGNIITAWSWFGTNMLNIGLHAYGGAKADEMALLATFVVSQLVIIGLGIGLVKPPVPTKA
jgi:ABC-type transport system involved in cytochrome c biogenesis permease subunit